MDDTAQTVQTALAGRLLFKWRRDLRAGLLTGPITEDTRLLPVVLKPSSPAVKPASDASRASAIEITIADATVRVCTGTDAALLRLVLQSLRA